MDGKRKEKGGTPAENPDQIQGNVLLNPNKILAYHRKHSPIKKEKQAEVKGRRDTTTPVGSYTRYMHPYIYNNNSCITNSSYKIINV